MRSYNKILLAVFILILFITVRITFLDVFPGLETDEGWYGIPAKNALLTGDWTYGGRPHVFYSPVFGGLTYVAYRLIGIGSIQARLLSVLFGLFTIGLVYLIGRRLYDTKIGLIAGLFYGMNAFVINMNRKGFVESVQLFFVLISFYYWISKRGPKRMLSGVMFGLALLTKPNIYYMVVPFFIWEVLRVCLGSTFYVKVKFFFSRRFIFECFRFVIPASIVFLSVHMMMYLLDSDSYVLSYQLVAYPRYYLNPPAMIETLKYILITAPFLFLFSIFLCVDSTYRKNVPLSRWTFIAWYGFVFFWICIVSAYQPNRYFMILYPAMALLCADFLIHIKDLRPRRLIRHLSPKHEKSIIIFIFVTIIGFQSISLAARYFRYRDDTAIEVSHYICKHIDKNAHIGGYSYLCLDIPNVSIDIYARVGGLFSRYKYTREYIIQEYNIHYILFNQESSHVGHHPTIKQYLLDNGEFLTTISSIEIWKVDSP